MRHSKLALKFVLSCYGVAIKEQRNFRGQVTRNYCIVTEFCSRGSLHDLLYPFSDGSHFYWIEYFFDRDICRNNLQSNPIQYNAGAERKESPLTLTQRLDIAKQIANAMDYLHSQATPILHLDLKPENILVCLSICLFVALDWIDWIGLDWELDWMAAVV